MTFRLETPDGTYEAERLRDLLWLILKHRSWHWLNGDGWVD